MSLSRSVSRAASSFSRVRLASRPVTALGRSIRFSPIVLPRTFSTSPWMLAKAIDDPLPAEPDIPAEYAEHIEGGNSYIDTGDYESARDSFAKALEIYRSPDVLFNKGVMEYCLKDHSAAISSWLECIALDPENTDAHSNLASAYVLSDPPKAHLAIKHLRAAIEIRPLDGEICFNLAAVLEATNQLKESLEMYERSRGLGIARAEQNVRSVGAKIMASQDKE
ncbi:Tetratricopeptide TPR2 [Phaffia rhodozyma]|uniref:Tetratricopeptide TPR2 n=1 Tax=Phaffia rhodozyma TaxID=264483 RepID=A0A0F7SJ08_PHARH|nr:Tetratricopeptide TPR2 [Phaffia rhodozyma]